MLNLKHIYYPLIMPNFHYLLLIDCTILYYTVGIHLILWIKPNNSRLTQNSVTILNIFVLKVRKVFFETCQTYTRKPWHLPLRNYSHHHSNNV